MELKPCPFCGGDNTNFREHNHWTGTRYIVVGGSLYHWCIDDRSVMKINAVDKETAAEKWNSRPYEGDPNAG